ncbi:MAG: 2-amino-4-hydroxy-6-hydroxymethyldihydropteridine diphosphokinase [Filimonas sp.]|nr:2-amino-4-hydroxy-6-hydroxymethyldihydropteridine diphosphokinase [Filimonas sp.]
MNDVYLLIGGNLGDRMAFLRQAKSLIGQSAGHITAISSIYETSAWGMEDQPPFYNCALQIKSNIAPETLMGILLNIETLMGRERLIKFGPRTIDIDMILYNDKIINTAILTLPHPQMQNRRFVLQPLAEIAGNAMHPVLHKTINQLLEECPDTLDVHKISGSI